MHKFKNNKLSFVIQIISLITSTLALSLILLFGNFILKTPLTEKILADSYTYIDQQRTSIREKETNLKWFKTKEEIEATSAGEYVSRFCKVQNIKLDVKNSENVPKSGKLIIIANHDNLLGGHFISGIVDQVRNSDNTKLVTSVDPSRGGQTLYKFLLHLVQNYNVYPNDYRRMKPGAEEVLKNTLDSGSAVVIFPRVGDYYSAHDKFAKTRPDRRFMDGFLRIAMDNQCDILPAHLELQYPFWWKILYHIVTPVVGNRILRAFMIDMYSNTTLKVTFGKLIPFDEIKKDQQYAIIKNGKTRYPDEVLKKYDDAVGK